MCKCVNIECGDYSNMEIIEFGEKRIQVDSCLVDEITYLLNQGVITIESCCGHNKLTGYIAVDKNSIELMESLGYEYHYNPFYPESKQFFNPKFV
ncbi:MAG: hypothetical protein E6343_16220 [Clostridium perfringens]|nr:hypothetical protein [Clostridium perfringens]